MKAVSNSSVLIALSAIGQLELLNQRFSEGILIPLAVWQEVVETGSGQPGAQAVAAASFIETRGSNTLSGDMTTQSWPEKFSVIPIVFFLK